MARFSTANSIINRAAVEVGLLKDASPVESTDESFIQLSELLQGAGQELVEMHAWQGLMMPFDLTTVDGDTGTYDLPDDFSYMIDQTGWDRTNNVMIGGPLSAQDWAYLKGRDLVSQSIYASFRLAENKFLLFPQPPPEGLEVSFEYISRNWVTTVGGNRSDSVTTGSDIVLYDPIMIIKYLKVKFLSAKGFDIAAAVAEFDMVFKARTGQDEGAPILNASNTGRTFPYLNGFGSVGDTGYGSQ
jgi:hypothetical protein